MGQAHGRRRRIGRVEPDDEGRGPCAPVPRGPRLAARAQAPQPAAAACQRWRRRRVAGAAARHAAARPSRTATAASRCVDAALDDGAPCGHPEEALAAGLHDLAACNAAKRKELDWVQHNEAVDAVRRVLRHHPGVVQAQLKDTVAAMLPCIGALRSSTARVALLFFMVPPPPPPLPCP